MIDAESQASEAHQPTAARLRHLADEHQSLDARLHHLATLLYPSVDETLEEHRLKKRKLALKDEIARLAQPG